jgi:RNA recognition motif-containing protein
MEQKHLQSTLYLGNISFLAREEDIRALFAPWGTVLAVQLITDKRSGERKGYGFVELSSAAEAEKALAQLAGTTFMELPLTVAPAKPTGKLADSGNKNNQRRQRTGQRR